MLEKWMKWTVLEAITKTISKVLQKLIGVSSSSFGHVFYATILVGIVQVIVSLPVVKFQKNSIWVNPLNVLGAVFFGAFAFASTAIVFWTFLFKEAEIGVNTFIITLSIIPGAFIDWIFFNHKLSVRQWAGMTVAVLAGYAILDCPSLQKITQMPIWIWLSFAAMTAAAINQGITQANKAIDPMVKNFWGGLTTVILGGIGLWYFPVENYPFNITACSLLTGVVIIFMWSYNLLSYKGGAYIALKKLVMNGSYLIMATVIGALFFGESITIAKIAGIILFLGAFILMDKNTWEVIRIISGGKKEQEKKQEELFPLVPLGKKDVDTTKKILDFIESSGSK